MDGTSQNDDPIYLPVIVLEQIARYLRPHDCLSLSISDIFHQFSFLHGRKSHLTISKCYSLTRASWNTFFERNVNPLTILHFDASNCYWLSKHLLIGAACLMINLKVLKIQGTKICLLDLPPVFEACKELEQLNLTLLDFDLNDWSNQQRNETSWRTLEDGFNRLTHLSIQSLGASQLKQKQSWPLIFVVLKWCYRNCAHVNIEVAYGGETILTNSMVSKLYETLMDSMSSLESLVITTKEVNYHSVLRMIDFSDLYETRSSNFLFASKYPRTIWIDGFVFGGDMSYKHPHDPEECACCNRERDVVHFKSINTAYLASEADQIPFLRSIEHISNEICTTPSPKLPALRYLRWRQVGDTTLLQISQLYPQLEELHFHLFDLPASFEGKWMLPKLKILVHASSLFKKSIIEKLVESCPNLEELHFTSARSTSIKPWTEDALAGLAFKRLTLLNVDGFDMDNGSFLSSLWKNCSQLQTLRLRGKFEKEVFLRNLVCELPLAQNLRELRIEWYHKESESDLLFLLKQLSKIPSLERLVLLEEPNPSWMPFHGFDASDAIHFDGSSSSSLANIPHFLLKFVTEMPRLVALCLFCFSIDQSSLEEFEKSINSEIRRLRPAFWYKIGNRFRSADFGSIQAPDAHRFEIVNRSDAFYMPPKSLFY